MSRVAGKLVDYKFDVPRFLSSHLILKMASNKAILYLAIITISMTVIAAHPSRQSDQMSEAINGVLRLFGYQVHKPPATQIVRVVPPNPFDFFDYEFE